ncbi:hypothetical protein B0H11DRAFT_1959970 [Mycena galericulata]|nr:hypothetical protein B0H11DRAFT_1959970 [Mycena galericulata]
MSGCRCLSMQGSLTSTHVYSTIGYLLDNICIILRDPLYVPWLHSNAAHLNILPLSCSSAEIGLFLWIKIGSDLCRGLSLLNDLTISDMAAQQISMVDPDRWKQFSKRSGLSVRIGFFIFSAGYLFGAFDGFLASFFLRLGPLGLLRTWRHILAWRVS